MTVTIWHNPRCSKSRQALGLLEEKGETPAVGSYLKTPPSADELRAALKQPGLRPRGLMPPKEAANPVVIGRPVVISGGKAPLGRPPARVLDVL